MLLRDVLVSCAINRAEANAAPRRTTASSLTPVGSSSIPLSRNVAVEMALRQRPRGSVIGMSSPARTNLDVFPISPGGNVQPER
jgi:hypothetical protein